MLAGLGSGQPTLRHQEVPGPSAGADRESTSAAAEEDNLGGHHKDKQSEGNGNARSCESRSRNRSGVVSRGTTPRVGNRCIVVGGLKSRGDTAAPRDRETRGIMLPLASLSLTPDYGNELWALPALDSVSVSQLIRDAYNDYEAGHTPHQGEDVELNEYWSGGLSASRSCSAGQPPDHVPTRDSGKCKRHYWTAPQEQFESLLGAIWGGAIPWCPLRPRRISWYG